ncbi:hypothetical protein ALP75_204072 [Pseudomonas syringae pv. actinidiae]|nr:hypothetical protein ALP75_204072 [Pseudomonas syringae pv. actinidiae]
MDGRAVLRIVPSRLCMKNAMAMTQGIQRRVFSSMIGAAEFCIGSCYNVKVMWLTSAPGS